MLQAFYRSAGLEWHFGNDAYTMKALDDVLYASAEDTSPML